MRAIGWVPWIVIVGVGCSGADTDAPTKKPPQTTDTSVTTVTTTDTQDTGPTATTTYDCTQPMPSPPLTVDNYAIETQEDFDFDSTGYLIYQAGLSDPFIVGTDKNAVEVVLSPGVAGDPRGVHGLSDGRIVIMSPWDGAIKIATPLTNSIDILAGGLTTPNGVDVGTNDRIYFTSLGEVGWTDVDGQASQVIHQWAGGTPNGVVLSPDEQRLTVAVPDWNETNIVTIDRLGPDEWGNVQVLYNINGYYSGIDQDVCGNIYTVEYNTGAVYRVTSDGTAENIANLDPSGGWAFSAVRFGTGIGGWERDRLYVTSRASRMYEIHTGIPGRRHPVSP